MCLCVFICSMSYDLEARTHVWNKYSQQKNQPIHSSGLIRGTLIPICRRNMVLSGAGTHTHTHTHTHDHEPFEATDANPWSD
jgi:hypothetical protein